MARFDTANSFRAAGLIGKYLRSRLTETERKELDDWLAADEQNRQLFRDLTSARMLEDDLEKFGKTDVESAWQRVQGQIVGRTNRIKKVSTRKIWWQSAAAVLILAFSVWQFRHHEPDKRLNKESLVSQYGEDVLPGTKKAVLVLGNGTRVKLDTGADSTFTEDGSSVQRTAGGALVYAKGPAIDNLNWNTILIPNGGEYKVVLEDGTKIWLNAASSLRYPVRFTGKERRVELTGGEAYFEIAKNKEKPFIVVTDRMEIQALGTAFDVNTYRRPDSSVSATLTEGKVQVRTKNASNYLLPGEQLAANEASARVFKADTEAVTAWKSGLFLFNGTALPEVMEQLARWYDVKIEYDKAFTEKKFFTGEIKRNVPVSKLLEMMELTGIARFRITDNTIIISSYSP